MTRKTLTLAAVVASLSLLAACSKSDDAQTPPPAEPAPSTAPAPAAPAAPTTPTPQDQSAPAGQQSMGDKIKDTAMAAKDKASEAGDAIADKAGEVAHKAGEAANSARESVKEGAAKADAAIQGAIGNGEKK